VRTGGLTLGRSAVLAGLLCLGTGCVSFERTMGAIRLEAHRVLWTGSELGEVDSTGDAFGFEVTPGIDSEAEMGPLWLGFAYSYAVLDAPWETGRTREHRMGIRARSSMLSQNTAIYPYAMVGAFVGHMDAEGEPRTYLGIGIEGGYGVRFGFGSWKKTVALDVELIASWCRFEQDYDSLSTRLGGALAVLF
jgi:hypothetical protein